MPDNRKIRIKKGYSDGKLKMSDRGHTWANKKDFINWMIDDHSDVTSIDIIEMKSGTDIFKTKPHPNGNEWSAEINHDAPDNSVYEYSITWSGTWGQKVFDPKISV